MTKAEALLDKIIKADAADWTYPSPARAIEVNRLEREYEAMTGQLCPSWPSRGRW